MTTFLLIHAGPTPWDEENRLAGSHSLPLTADGLAAAEALVGHLAPPPDAVYAPLENEACAQVAGLLSERFDLKLRDLEDLAEVRLGLWEGLTREDLEHRFERAYGQWVEEPLTVCPPEGETVSDAIDRLRPAVRKIARRQKGHRVALVLRPMAMQIVRGLLHREPPEAIAARLHNLDVMETIELSDEESDLLGR